MLLAVAFHHRPQTTYQWAVAAWTLSRVTHCELVVGDRWLGASAGRGTYLQHPPADRADWSVIPVTYSAPESALRRWAEGEVGCGYDWAGVFLSQVFGLAREDRDRWFCSELCVAGLQRAGLYPALRAHEWSPSELHRLLTRAPAPAR